ncbi:MAG: sugar transferase [Flavobacteriaceae bacterium]|nr:sugar transferase [Flavobacteriaceae bacterium]
MLTKKQQLVKRFFDLFFSILGILILTFPILVLAILATLATKNNGIFIQKRIGMHAEPFYILKLRTMINSDSKDNITLKNDPRITKFGKLLRKYNLDELPQIYNVFIGNMSFVGPRPDVKGYADILQGDDKVILNIKPGITGPATLKFKNENEILSIKSNPKKYNDEILWKEKVEINKNYIKNWSLKNDLKYILKTLF